MDFVSQDRVSPITVIDFAETLNKGELSDVDLSKAFNRVSDHLVHFHHNHYHYGICVDVLDWIKNFILNRSQQAIIDGKKVTYM